MDIPVYCINLHSAELRRKRMIDRFKIMGFTNVNFIKAASAGSKLVEFYIEGMKDWYENKDYFIGRDQFRKDVGCFASHILALKTFIATNDPYCLICEDDIMFHNNFPTLFQDVISNLPLGANLLSLSYMVAGKINQEYIYKCPDINQQDFLPAEMWTPEKQEEISNSFNSPRKLNKSSEESFENLSEDSSEILSDESSEILSEESSNSPKKTSNLSDNSSNSSDKTSNSSEESLNLSEKLSDFLEPTNISDDKFQNSSESIDDSIDIEQKDSTKKCETINNNDSIYHGFWKIDPKYTWGAQCYYISNTYALQIIRELDRPLIISCNDSLYSSASNMLKEDNKITSEIILRKSSGYMTSIPLVIEDGITSCRAPQDIQYHLRHFCRWNWNNYNKCDPERESPLSKLNPNDSWPGYPFSQ
jgi:GR25 family glycosyltransferase involved in LPS biosynthesis